MKKILAKIVFFILFVSSASVLCFGFGLFGDRCGVFQEVKQRWDWDYHDIRYDRAFSIKDERITSMTLTSTLEHGGATYDIVFDDDVRYEAYVDSRGKGIRYCYDENERVKSNSFWYRIDKKGLVRFRWIRLWENVTMVMAIYVLPIIVLLLLFGNHEKRESDSKLL